MKLFTKPSTKQQTKCLRTKTNTSSTRVSPTASAIRARAVRGALVLLFATAAAFTTSCKKSDSTNPLIVWTDNRDFASYVEYFNATHDDAKAIVVYKEEPANALPSSRTEATPDIIVGSWLKSGSTRKYFTSLDKLFKEKDPKINQEIFYSSLFEYGKTMGSTYLIPVSFNLPMMVFSYANEETIQETHLLSPEQIKTLATEFNTLNSYKEYSAMGYGPSWDKEFLYEVSKLRGVNYHERGNTFAYNKNALSATSQFFKDWTLESNTSNAAEQNFQFKYLYNPKHKQVSSGRCLFAFMTSDQYYNLKEEQSSDLTFRWLHSDNKIQVEDDIITMGIYKHSTQQKKAQEFITWFCTEETQRALMERASSMHLDTVSFGIAGGFSSIRSVNQTVFPTYYRTVLENLPAEENLVLPPALPYTWPDLKENVILPYLYDSIDPETGSTKNSMDQRINDWSKSHF